MSAIIFHPKARDELFSSIAYYNEKSPGLGIEFLEDIKKNVQNIQSNPKRWKIVKNQIRKCIYNAFPSQYSISLLRNRYS